ncbi:hypothetical protein DUNSADRAFT_3980 [Dunaliella salina]|uniref:Secreted protein n=1 Tax=Dunaliella salina TaxID=3046 RepID=A0ABQ7GSZ6_DUNSA|nr:hypothetical protein DUNSADRAFT_3980 [Dunaliella salina]|eukprot:KAF5837725.1 hypothetical protein DUNSADRAFT_3980 [Dunaliella salina]
MLNVQFWCFKLWPMPSVLLGSMHSCLGSGMNAGVACLESCLVNVSRSRWAPHQNRPHMPTFTHSLRLLAHLPFGPPTFWPTHLHPW